MDKLTIFLLPPVFRGFIALIVSGAVFPLCGVTIIRLNLIPLRYMLMHGVILGGAIALAFSLPLVPVTIAVNTILVLVMIKFTRNSSFGFGSSSAAVMVLGMALASLLTHIADVPAKDTLDLLWGSPFALTNKDFAVLFILAVIIAVYLAINLKNVLALFYNAEVASSLGINVRFHYTLMVLIIAFTVALAIKLLGAFLIDALLILPVLFAASLLKKSHGIKRLFAFSSVSGLAFAVAGYFLAVVLDLPPGATIAVIASLAYAVSLTVK
ncbi:metal ABC transporter permease [Treponema parvum]|uniref:Metal ABC transporter permease n=1 Tax=Treponema parvum TaxID=138851 RepID=A0A975IBV8_9SPIR|nr:metal ABC transporter permease [Treponema parvum]QTQ11112.1 metal ABC transporter permease [Treponema parvum]